MSVDSLDSIHVGMSREDSQETAHQICDALRGPAQAPHPGPAPDESATVAVKTAYAVKADAYIQGLIEKPNLTEAEQKHLMSAVTRWSKGPRD